MVARFAGARSLDDRRRRRIATGTKTDTSPPMSANIVFESPNGHDSGGPTLPSANHFLLRKSISPSLWKHAFIGVAILAVGAGLLMAVSADWSTMSSYGPGVPQMMSVTAARGVSCLAGALLLIAGELSLLCWWTRSRSPEDFSGRYRIWLPTAMTLFVWAGSMATGAHHLLGTIAAHLLNVRMDHSVTLCWLLPTVVWGVVVLRPLSAEMHGCRLSLSMLWLAVLGWLTAGWLLLGFPSPLAGVGLGLTQSGAALLGNWFLFVSLLLHTRHVIHVTAEPPAVRRSRWMLLKSRFRRSSVVASAPSGRTKQEDLDNEQEAEERRKPSTAATENCSSEISPTAQRQSASVDKQAESAAAPIEKDEATSLGTHIDGPPTPEQLRGLSKRERRQLRKQWRDAQRSTADSIAP